MLNSIQTLRAIAAWMVVLHHFAQIFFNFQGTNLFLVLFSHYGDLGVDLFFIISGFVIYYATVRKSVTPSHFMLLRLARIVPAYWLFTFVTVLFVYYFDNPIPLTKLEPGFLLKSMFFVPVVNPAGIGLYPLLTVGWTLNFEMIFYLVFSLSLFLPERYRLLGVAMGILCIQMGISKLGGVFSFYSSKLIFEFLIGIVIGIMYRKGWIQRINPTLAIVMAAVSVMFIATKDYNFPYFKIGIPMIVIAAISQEKRFQRLRFMGNLGDWSYSTYLCHTLVLNIAYQASSLWQLNPYAALSAASLVIVFISWLSFTVVERNISTLIKHKLQARQRPVFRLS